MNNNHNKFNHNTLENVSYGSLADIFDAIATAHTQDILPHISNAVVYDGTADTIEELLYQAGQDVPQ